MNTPNNARSTASKLGIKEAFIELLRTKPIVAVSVQEICKVADVNRTTFYAHFTNINDLLEDIESDLYYEVEETVLPKSSDISLLISKNTMLRLLAFIRKNEILYKVYFSQGTESRIINELSDSVYKLYEPAMRKRNLYSDAEYAYLFEFCKMGLLGIIRKWILSGHAEPEQDIANLIENLLKRCLS